MLCRVTQIRSYVKVRIQVNEVTEDPIKLPSDPISSSSFSKQLRVCPVMSKLILDAHDAAFARLRVYSVLLEMCSNFWPTLCKRIALCLYGEVFCLLSLCKTRATPSPSFLLSAHTSTVCVASRPRLQNICRALAGQKEEEISSQKERERGKERERRGEREREKENRKEGEGGGILSLLRRLNRASLPLLFPPPLL